MGAFRTLSPPRPAPTCSVPRSRPIVGGGGGRGTGQAGSRRGESEAGSGTEVRQQAGTRIDVGGSPPGSPDHTVRLWLRRHGALALSGEAPLALARIVAPAPPPAGAREATRAERLGATHPEVSPWTRDHRTCTTACTPMPPRSSSIAPFAPSAPACRAGWGRWATSSPEPPSPSASTSPRGLPLDRSP